MRAIQRVAIIVSCAALASVCGCGTEQVPTVQSPQQAADEGLVVPVTYSIIDSYTLPDVKRSLTVRLSEKVSEDTLHSIAMELKAQDPRHYERTFIGYYLPGMELGRTAWATTHFDPDLEIRILGVSLAQEEYFQKQAPAPHSSVIGSWLYEILGAPDMNRTYTIYREEKSLHMRTTWTDGGSGTETIAEKVHPMGRLFQTNKQAAVGEYFLLDGEGNLQLWDKEGRFATAKKRNAPPRAPIGGEMEADPVRPPVKQGREPSSAQFWLRIGFFNDSKEKPLSRNCRMWIRGFGDFWPVRQQDWRFGGTLIEKAGPFGTGGTYGSENVIYFYPDYSDESKVIRVPFKYSAEMNPEGSPRDMVTVAVGPKTIVFTGVAIKNATGRLQQAYDRDTCRAVESLSESR